MRNTFHLNTMIKTRRRMQVIQPRQKYIDEDQHIREGLDDELSGEEHLEVDQDPTSYSS
jgi:hypothetical protein